VKYWDESGAEEVKDGNMVSLAKIMLMISTIMCFGLQCTEIVISESIVLNHTEIYIFDLYSWLID
jgi:hypothetical protein